MTKPIKAYAAKVINSVILSSVSDTRIGVRTRIGYVYTKESPRRGNWKIGWKEAKKQGYRVVKVEIREIDE